MLTFIDLWVYRITCNEKSIGIKASIWYNCQREVFFFFFAPWETCNTWTVLKSVWLNCKVQNMANLKFSSLFFFVFFLDIISLVLRLHIKWMDAENERNPRNQKVCEWGSISPNCGDSMCVVREDPQRDCLVKDPELVRGKEPAHLEFMLCAVCCTNRVFIQVSRLSLVQRGNSFSAALKTAL